MSDKRKVSTDALETLGTIIKTGKRDAIHLAVEPIIAGERLWPGHDVGIINGKATTKATKKLGIVDPFIKGAVPEGEMFWLVIYPRTITSLQHVWEHPDFSGYTGPSPEEIEKTQSEEWIDAFAETLSIETDELMDAAAHYTKTGNYTNLGSNENYSDHYEKFPEFWAHYETVTGKEPKHGNGNFFSCAC